MQKETIITLKKTGLQGLSDLKEDQFVAKNDPSSTSNTVFNEKHSVASKYHLK